MGTKQYDSATDLLTFSRASGGTALSKISYGNNLVTNGTFDTDLSGWTTDTEWVYSNGKAALPANAQSNRSLSSTKAYVKAGKTYRVRFDASTSVGTPVNTYLKLRIWGNDNGTGAFLYNGSYILTGSHERLISPTANGYMSFDNVISNSFDKFIDNVSIEEILFDQADGTLQLYNYPNNVPRIEYDATGAVKGLLIEEARTNLYLKSNQFVSPWNLIGSTVTASAGTSPTGLADAWRWVGNGTSILYQGTSHVAGDYTVSAWVKSNGAGEDTFRLYGLNSLISLDFTATSEWVRYSYTFTSAIVGSRYSGLVYGSSQGNVDLLVYGLQIEAGAFPTSYIPTTGAAATRAMDLAEIPTSAFGYNNDAGSLVIDVLAPVADQLMPLAIFNTSSYSNSRSLWKGNSALNASGDYFVFNTYDGATTQFILSQQTQAEHTKLGLSYGDNERAVRDGGTVGSGDSRSPSPTRLLLGGRDNGFQSQCWIKSIQYYPRQLTNTQLQELTAAGSSLRAYALGNSTVGPYSGQPSIISLVTTSNTKVNVAVAGDTIAQQKADWNSLSVNSLGTAWVVLQVGLNDLNPSVGTTASKIAEIQDLVDTIKADIGSKPLYVAKMLPCKQRLVDVYGANAALSQQRWVDMNEAIAGNGSSPITGVQGRIVSHVPLMDDGLGNLKAVYDLGDHIHPNTAGRQIMATAWEGFTT